MILRRVFTKVGQDGLEFVAPYFYTTTLKTYVKKNLGRMKKFGQDGFGHPAQIVIEAIGCGI
jgi:hypothetical protein